MKKLTIFVLVILFLFASCVPTSKDDGLKSLYDEIILDGSNTRNALFTSGMSVEEVLKTLNLKEEDLASMETYPLDEKSSPVEGASEMTMMGTNALYCFEEFGEELPFRLMFVFYDNALRQVGYNLYYDLDDLGEAYDLALEFMNAFIKKTGAKPVETGTEFEYNTYGSSEKDTFTSAGGRYACQFFHGGVLGEIGFSSFSPTPDQGYAQDVMIQLGISLMLDRIGQ